MVSRIELLTRLSGIFLVAGIAALCLAILMYAGFHLHDYLVLMQKARARYRSERPYAYRPEDNEAVPEKHTVQNPSDILRAEEKQAKEKAKESVKEAVNKDAKPKAEPAAEEKPEGKAESKAEKKTEREAAPAPEPTASPAAAAQDMSKQGKAEIIDAAPMQAPSGENGEASARAAAQEPEIAAGDGSGNARGTASGKMPAETSAAADQPEPAVKAPVKPAFRLTRHVLITSGAVPDKA